RARTAAYPTQTSGGVRLTIDLPTLMGLTERAGDLEDWGPVVSDLARQIADALHGSPWDASVTDPATGLPIWVGTTRRRPTTTQRRWIQATNPACVFPAAADQPPNATSTTPCPSAAMAKPPSSTSARSVPATTYAPNTKPDGNSPNPNPAPSAGPVPAATNTKCDPGRRDRLLGQRPLGCQTVFVSAKAAITYGDRSPNSPSSTTRFTLWTAPSWMRRRCSGVAPAAAMALTSMWSASHGISSSVWPVRIFTTPGGTSEVARTSARVTAGIGRDSDAITTAVLPDTSTADRRDTRPSRAESWGATIPTTPVGSGAEMLKNGPATGLRLP